MTWNDYFCTELTLLVAESILLLLPMLSIASKPQFGTQVPLETVHYLI